MRHQLTQSNQTASVGSNNSNSYCKNLLSDYYDSQDLRLPTVRSNAAVWS
jgi:hypothetical protein